MHIEEHDIAHLVEKDNVGKNIIATQYSKWYPTLIGQFSADTDEPVDFKNWLFNFRKITDHLEESMEYIPS